MALSPDEQAAVDRFLAEHGVQRVAYDPARDPRRLSLFWRKRHKTASAARARVLAGDTTKLYASRDRPDDTTGEEA